MTQSNETREAAERRGNDLIAAVLSDHADIKSLMNDVSVARNDRDAHFCRLVEKLAVHETAEEEILHPMARSVSSSSLVEQRLSEESNGKAALAELERIGVDSPQFDAKFRRVRDEVLAHAQREEDEELPALEREVDSDRLGRAASIFRAAQRVAPTHAHAHSPESATGNVLVGTFVAAADRARDALREAMDGPSI
jgi:hemerythrin superfamily protein